MNWLRRELGRQVDGSSLGLFRIIWGLLMFWEALRKLPKVTGMYSPEYFHFKYSLFPFVQPLPEVWMMQVEVWFMIAAAALLTAGVCFRGAAAVYLLVYTHLFLIEKLYYNNHFYLTILIGFLMMVSSADACYRLRWPRQGTSAIDPPTIPLWNLVLLRGQVMVVYLFGGIAKLNSDWIMGEPVRFWFSNRDPNVGAILFDPLLGQEWFVWLVCVSGVAIDLTIGFFLLHRRTRIPAMLLLIGFHATNSQLFTIGLFPWIGICLLLLFIDPDRPRQVFEWLGRLRRRASNGAERSASAAKALESSGPAGWGATVFVVGYLAFQALWPLRSCCYRDNPSWTEVGHGFSWRMMLRNKDAFLQFTFDPPAVERHLEAHPELLPRISKAHLTKMVKSPHFILQYAHALSDGLERGGIRAVKIRCVSVVSLNGRPYQLMIDPTVDLATASYGFFEVPEWIMPLDRYRRPGQYPIHPDERKQAIREALAEYKRTRGLEQAVRIVQPPDPDRHRR